MDFDPNRYGADVAEILQELPVQEAAVGFRFMHRDNAAEAFAYLPSEKQEELIGALGAEASVKMVEAMDPDDRVRLLDEVPEEVAHRLMASLTPEKRKETQAILGYPPRSVGRLMTPDYVRVRSDWTIGAALDHIRRYGRDAETINVVYVVDEQGKLIDDVRLRQILLSKPEDAVETIMNRQFVSLRADQPQEEAVEMLQRYDRVALPVVDSRGVLLGIVTHDDVAGRVGKSRSAVSNTLRLLQLPPSIQQFVREGRLSAGHARALLATPDRAFQEQLARKIVTEGLTVRAVEDAVRFRVAGHVAGHRASHAAWMSSISLRSVSRSWSFAIGMLNSALVTTCA